MKKKYIGENNSYELLSGKESEMTEAKQVHRKVLVVTRLLFFLCYFRVFIIVFFRILPYYV